MSALSDAELRQLIADPPAPSLSAAKKQRVGWVLDTSNARGKRGAFGAKVQKAMMDKMVATTGTGDPLSQEEALAVSVQIKKC